MLLEDTGKELLDEIVHKTLGPYNTDQVNNLKKELDFVDKKLEALKQEAESSGITKELSINFALLKAYKDRNVRILKTYVFNRFLKIMTNYFEKNDIKGLLSASESNFESEYLNICEEYLSSSKHLDLMDRDPPLNFFVQIMTLEDCGMILNGDDFIELKKGRLYFLRKADVAHLISARLVKLL